MREAKTGKIEYRTDRGANVHIPIGKRSFDERARGLRRTSAQTRTRRNNFFLFSVPYGFTSSP